MKAISFFSRDQAKPAPAVNIQNIRIASPCSADWNQMPGNDRVRHCEACNLNVYNFSAMTEPEIKRLVAEREGRLCARMYQRTDGTMLTQNCPVGLKALTRRLSRIAGALAAMLPNFAAVQPIAGQSYTRTNVGDAAIQLQVVDQQGAVIPNANVTLTPLADGKPIHGKTDKHGQLLVRRPRAGQYRLQVSYSGLHSDSDTVELRTGEILSFRTVLSVGGFMGEVVEVGASHPPDKNAVSPDMAATPARSAPRPLQR